MGGTWTLRVSGHIIGVSRSTLLEAHLMDYFGARVGLLLLAVRSGRNWQTIHRESGIQLGR
jgi:hypothetical protein